jgi:mono/diheme cytochrome c family protein
VAIVGFLIPWLLIGIAVVFIAFSGGPGAAREAYLTRGKTVFRVLIPIVYIGMGIAIPALILADREERAGATDKLASKKVSDAPKDLERGKELFHETCAQCHTLAAANARGIAGPNLDKVGKLTPERVLSAIKIGGTGQGRMPAQLLEGENAKAVADYLAAVAGK